MRVVGIIQARMSSTRLPGKVLMPVMGETSMLQLIINRVARAARVDEWWVATSSSPEDDPIAALAERVGMKAHRGDVDDVLSRFVAIVGQVESAWTVRVTADCPLVDAAVIDLLVDQALAARPTIEVISQAYDDPAEEHLRWAPLGYVPEVARTGALLRAAAEIPASQPFHRAHVLSWLYRGDAFEPLARPPAWAPHPEWRWTVDTAADLDFVRAVAAHLGPALTSVGYDGISRLIEAQPELANINAGIRPKPLEAG